MTKIYAQGDILFVRRRQILQEMTEASAPERHILAYGEATGHHHSVLVNRAKFFAPDRPAGGALLIGFLEVGKEGVSVEHQEHAPVDLTPGIWEVRRQREATDDDEPQIVTD